MDTKEASISTLQNLSAFIFLFKSQKIAKLAIRAFNGLHHKDYVKFDIRVEESTLTPYFTDSNPNTAIGPDIGLPMTEVLALNGVDFDDVLLSMLSKYAKQITP